MASQSTDQPRSLGGIVLIRDLFPAIPHLLIIGGIILLFILMVRTSKAGSHRKEEQKREATVRQNTTLRFAKTKAMVRQNAFPTSPDSGTAILREMQDTAAG
jgi:hypothetical protein